MLSRNNSLLSPHSFSVHRIKSRGRITAEAKTIQRMKWEDGKSARSLKMYIFKTGEVIQIIRKSNSKKPADKGTHLSWTREAAAEVAELSHSQRPCWSWCPGPFWNYGVSYFDSTRGEGAALSVTFVQELPWLRGITMGTPAKLMALPRSCLFSEGICI